MRPTAGGKKLAPPDRGFRWCGEQGEWSPTNEQEMVLNLGGKVMLRKTAVCLACFLGTGLFILLGTGDSGAADGKVPVSFTNNTDGDFEVFWLDTSNGKKVYYGTVRKGKTKDTQTFNGHVWVICNSKGQELGRFTVKTEPGTGDELA